MTPDPHPGNYYVSVVDGPRFSVLAGSWRSHGEALAHVEDVRALAVERDAWADFYSFGTVRMADNYTKEGMLNRFLAESIPK